MGKFWEEIMNKLNKAIFTVIWVDFLIVSLIVIGSYLCLVTGTPIETIKKIIIVVITVALFVLYWIAYYFTMQIVLEAANAKGYAHLENKLIFIGIVGLIVTPALLVAALPDKVSQEELQVNNQSAPNVDSELPEL